jgi:iron complex outermembrane receptor protein
MVPRTTTREQALYAQANYDLGDVWQTLSGVKLTGGYRYSFDYASSTQNSYDALGLCQSNPALSVPNCTSAASGHFNEGTWTLALDYQVTPSTLVYTTARRGYDPGGFNAYAPASAEREYQPEHLTDVEVGVKSNWSLWGMDARTSLDGWHDHYTNIQRQVAVVGAGINTITENAALATLEGVEFEGTLVPIKSVELTGLYAYSNSRYDKYLSPTAGDLSGLPFTGGPRNQYSATGKYHLPVADRLGDLSLSATYSWEGHIQFSDREPGGIIPAHGLLDLRVDWNDLAGRPIDASFFMTNATDQTYVQGGTIVYDALGLDSVIYGPPRMWGVQFRYHFGPRQ